MKREAVAEQSTCPTCGHENPADQRFCTECGTALSATCPNCGETNPPGARFCGHCALPLEQVPARSQLPEERRLATVLFADISGFTNLSRAKDPEELNQMVNACMEKLGAVVERYDGFVDKVIGDAIMAVFGAPIAHGDDPERAVRAALDMQRCADENAPEFGAELALSVGVNTGEVYFAPVGPDTRQTVLGAAVNAAQRLQAGAGAGEVYVGDETRRVTQRAIEYEPVEPVRVKVAEEPLPAWRAVRLKTIGEEAPAYGAPMVGREHELDVLSRTWERVSSERRPYLVTVIGPPGIGKTRLASELMRFVAEQGGRPVRGRAFPFGQAAYAVLSQQITHVAGIYETDSIPAAREKLDRFVASLVPGEFAGDVASHLAALIGLAGDETIPDKQVLFFSVRRLVDALAREQPLLLVFEDIHWADPSLLDLVEHLAARLREVPVLLLTLARPELLEARSGWGGGLAAYTALSLDPLSPAEARDLALRLLEQRADQVSEEIADRLGATAEGNPLFIEELAASLVEQATEATGELPTTVRGIIAARLDALPREERAVVLDAAVVGKVFWRGALASLGSGDGRLDELLDSLEGRDLVRRESFSSIEGDQEYSFKHVLIREVAYATLPKALRPTLHAAVAGFIERAAGERVAESAAVLAHHWSEAGEAPRALEYVLLAADQAARAWAKGEAAALYARALELMPEEDKRRREVRIRRTLALVDAGDYRGAIPELDALRSEVDGRELFDVLQGRFKATFWGLTDAEASRALAEEARRLAQELGDQDLRALAVARQAAAVAMDGQVEQARALGREAIAAWAPATRQADLAETLEWHSLHHYWLGRYEGGLEPARRAIEIGARVYSVAGLVNGHADLALALTGLGRHEEALAYFERGAAYGRELELQPRFTARLTNMWAGTLRELYELDESRRLNEQAIESARRVAFGGGVVSGEIDLAMIDLLAGDVGRAEAALPGLAEAAAGTKGWHQWLWTTRIAAAKAEVALAAGRPEAAVEDARGAVEMAARYGRAKYVAQARLLLGTALLELGRNREAVAALTEALADAERLAHPPSIWRAAAKLAAGLYASGDDGEAETAFRKAEETLQAFAVGLSEERRQPFLAAPQLAEVLALAR